ncbi:hypothetical protein ACFQ1S_29790 [Kibdelosporangium lantanae]|uniref:DUF3558 domain-containing protein n=1 Tax=Kibdelosporangium lantanae TaxID=1497396 RepID=A0ABW3MJ16_9PSEU
MRLLAVCCGVVLAVSLTACGQGKAAAQQYRKHVDACKLLKPETVAALSADLPTTNTDWTQPAAGTSDMSTCKRGFGAVGDVVAHENSKVPNVPGKPAYRYITVETQRFEDRDDQPGADRARYFLKSYATSVDLVAPTADDFEEKHITFTPEGALSHASLWAVDKNLVVHIEYGGGNVRSVPDGLTENAARDGITRLANDAAALRPPCD